MNIFVTGATGWIGSAVTPELISRGHRVTGLARSDRSAATLEAWGATALRGELSDLDVLRAGADAAEGVVHLGFSHDFSDFAGAGRTERAAVQAFGDVLSGSDRPLLIASGIWRSPHDVLTEEVRLADGGVDAPRGSSEALALSFADRGVRAIAGRFARTVHGHGDHGFVAALAAVAREKGVSGYPGDGAGRWTAVHRTDLARLVRLALENAPAGTVVHGVAERGIPAWALAEGIGRALGLPVASIDPADAPEHFGWMSMLFGDDVPASSARTQELLGWYPDQPTILEDLAAGAYGTA